ncbi:MAG: hypothetical protein WDN28_31720 [Chthoniobacter sp.]
MSFGAEMPADPGSGEGAWAKNRRAEFVSSVKLSTWEGAADVLMNDARTTNS